MNEEGRFSDIGWQGSEREKLWRYNQHYFDDLNALNNQERLEWHQRLLTSWVRENPPAAGVGWDPYPTSLRIVNWIKWILNGNTPPDELVKSLAIQARWLMQRLEWHILGNHLFSNAKALVFVGLYFQDAEAETWLNKGLGILKDEIAEQILADGGHFERSTMYHALALEDMLDLVNLLKTYENSLGPRQRGFAHRCRLKVNDMLFWHRAMCHSDGEISFFNDAAFGIAPSTEELYTYATRLGFDSPPSPSQITNLSNTGYVRLDTQDAVAILDMAPIGPDYLPGHAHADTLSFELSIRQSRVFVNSGTSVYGLGDERLRQRGTSAHNTVIIGGENSSEVWSGFRVARRAQPGPTQIDGTTGCHATCTHDGYMRLKNGGLHTRHYHLGVTSLEIEDVVPTQAYVAEARYHVHPGVDVTIANDGVSGTLYLPTGEEIAWHSRGGKPRLEATTWHPEFGVSVPTNCLVVPVENGCCGLALNWT